MLEMRPNYTGMKCWLSIIALLVSGAMASADNELLTYSVVVVRGTEQPNPPVQGAKLVSGNLAQRLSRFRWKHYWEIRRDSVTVGPKRPAKLPVTRKRTLEVALVGNQQVEMHLYRDGKIVRTARQKVHSNSCEIMGGVDEKDSWFIVVRKTE